MSPGSYLLVVRTTNQAAFRAFYSLDSAVPLVGPYEGNLANEGEQVTLKVSSGGSEIASFKYGGGRGWPIGPRACPKPRRFSCPASGRVP